MRTFPCVWHARCPPQFYRAELCFIEDPSILASPAVNLLVDASLTAFEGPPVGHSLHAYYRQQHAAAVARAAVMFPTWVSVLTGAA